jgi:acetaldehyde dehydrogenase/alcohol dehydrogenase
LDLGGETQEEQINALVEAIRNIMKQLNIPMSFRECGIDEKEYFAKIPQIAERAFEDQCTTTNPRYPLVSELEEILRQAW